MQGAAFRYEGQWPSGHFAQARSPLSFVAAALAVIVLCVVVGGDVVAVSLRRSQSQVLAAPDAIQTLQFSDEGKVSTAALFFLILSSCLFFFQLTAPSFRSGGDYYRARGAVRVAGRPLGAVCRPRQVVRPLAGRDIRPRLGRKVRKQKAKQEEIA